MDLRAPLQLDHCIVNDGGFIEILEQSMQYLLCRLYLASQMMEIGSESRFTCLILFRRYVGLFQKVIRERHHDGGTQMTQQEIKQIKSHLGRIAAACLFLGCKSEEEPRRIRDIINLSSILDFENVCPGSSMSTELDRSGNGELLNRQKNDSEGQDSSIPTATAETALPITERKQPPPLDDKYWSDKDKMVSTEQQLLRMLQFDTIVCHPYRCVLAVMDTLDFGRGSKSQSQTQTNKCLLSSKSSEALIFKAFSILNEISIDAVLGTMILQYAVITLACAVVGVAADSNQRSMEGYDETLPTDWWRALDVPTDDFVSATDRIRNLLS